MVTFEEAVLLVDSYLSDSDIPLSMTIQGEFKDGWYFCYQSKEFVETGSFSSQLAGNAPILVDKETGEMLMLGTSNPVEEYLEEYSRVKNDRRKK